MKKVIEQINFIIPSVSLPSIPKNQSSDFSRAADTKSQYDLCLRYSSRPIFERLFILCFKSVFSDVLLQCDFQIILTLRLVSKEVRHLASTINTSNSHSPLNCKAVIPFKYSDIHPAANLSILEKFKFAQQYNMDMDITISIQDLKKLLQSISPFNSLPENRLSKLTIKIDKLEEIGELEALIINQTNLPFFERINGFNLSDLKMEPNMIDPILSLLTSATKPCSNLITLIFGNLETESKLDLSNCDLSNLTSLSFSAISKTAKLILPNKLSTLKTLSFCSVHSNSKLDLSSYDLSNLTVLSLDTIGDNVTLTLPQMLPKLKTFSIKNISYDIKIDLSHCDLSNLTDLSLGNVNFQFTLIPPKKLPNLERFSIQNITYGSNIDLSHCDLPKLRDLSLGSIDNNVVFKLPQILPKLEVLSIQNIAHGINIDLSDCDLPKFTDLSLRNVGFKFKLIPPQKLASLERFSIQNIANGSNIDLAHCDLPNLRDLSLGSIDKKAVLLLPNKFPKLERFQYKKEEDLRDLSQRLPLLFLQLKLAITSCLPQASTVYIGLLFFFIVCMVRGFVLNARTINPS